MAYLYYICSVLFLLCLLIDITWRIWKRKLSFLPALPNVPWLGSIPFHPTDPHDIYKARIAAATKFNHLFVVWRLHKPVIITGRLEYIEPLLKSQETLKSVSYTSLFREWSGDGLLISAGSKWKKRRTSLTGAFHFSILKGFMEIFERQAKHLVNKLQELSSGNKVVEVQRILSLATLDVICETSMGVCINALDSSNSEYVISLERIKALLLKRMLSPLSGSKFIYPYTRDGKEYYKYLDVLHSFTMNVIKENLISRQQSPMEKQSEDDSHESYRRKHKVLIDILMDLYEKGEVDLDGIRDEVDTFMVAGHDTTSSALSWALYEIGRHPEIQDKLHDEIDNVSSKDSSLIDKVRSLKYLECVLKESLRMHPSVPLFERELQKEMVIDNNIIPTGTIIQVAAFDIHMNPAYWENPTVFNPSRFQSEGFTKRNPYTYIPFSAGPRACLGQKFAMFEEKVFLYEILSCFDIKSTQKRDELKIGFQLIASSMNGIYVEFSKRN